jgi:membrane-bound lytic murein transglycosylase B
MATSPDFLNTLANAQNIDFFGKTIKSLQTQGEARKIERVTDIIRQEEKSSAILSNELRTVDEKIDELSSLPILSETEEDIKAMSARGVELMNMLEKKRQATQQVTQEHMMSLGAIGTDDAARVANELARKQGLTNKELDRKLDKFNYQIELEKGMVSLENGKNVLEKYKYDVKAREGLATASNAIMENERYKSLASIVLKSANENELRRHNQSIQQIISQVAEETGLEKSVVEDALASLNSYTSRIKETTSVAKSKKTKEEMASDTFTNAYKTVQDATRVLEYARKTKVNPNEEQSESIYDMATRMYKRGADTDLDEKVPQQVKDLMTMFDAKSEYSIAVRQLKAIDPYGTASETDSDELFTDQIGGRMLPDAITKSIGSFKIANDKIYRDLILETSVGGVLTGDTAFSADALAEITGEINKYVEAADVGFAAPPENVSPPIFGGQYGGYFSSPVNVGQPIPDAPLTEEQTEILKWNEFVAAGMIPANVSMENRDLETYFEAVGKGTEGELLDEPQSLILTDKRVLNPAITKHFPGAPVSVRNVVGRALKYETELRNASAVSGVSEQLLMSVFSTESKFDQKAKSSVGAVGIGQLMDGAVTDVLPKMKKLYPDENLTIEGIKNDAEKNIMASALYLARAKDLVDGAGLDVTLINILRAYNGGIGSLKKQIKGTKTMSVENEEYPGRVDEWSKFYNDIRRR